MCPVLGFQCHMCVTNSHTCSVGFCIALCVVPALKFWAVQSEACSSTAEYECTSFLRKLCWNYFEIVFTENKLKRKRNENTLSFLKKKKKRPYKNNNIKVFSYLYLSVNRSAWCWECVQLSCCSFVSDSNTPQVLLSTVVQVSRSSEANLAVRPQHSEHV